MDTNTKKLFCATFLTRQQVDYLDKIGKDYLFIHGKKLARTKILSELVDLAMKLDIDVSKISNNGESLSSEILKLIKNER